MNNKEADYVTSSLGQIAFLLWHNIYPADLTFKPFVGCVYYDSSINWGEIINSYWLGEKIPSCELSECIVVAKRMLEEGEIKSEWFKELEEAVDDLQEDYVFPVI